MRIAFSGAHRTGKTTLVQALGDALPGYEVIDEPYAALDEEGHDFSDPPTTEDFEVQLRRSLEIVTAAPANALIDRSPLDFVAYLGVSEGDAVDAETLRAAMGALDLIVLVPIEAPDRIVVAASEDRRLRSAVDEMLSSLVLDDRYGFGVEVLEVNGRVDARVSQVLA
ncbi:MAG: AAA family ATPase, partial [Polyangiales bacterium]